MNIKQLALDFVRENNCAMNVSVELIEKAMEKSALIAVEDAIHKIKEARIELERTRAKANRPQ